jgi:hypothetical protein
LPPLRNSRIRLRARPAFDSSARRFKRRNTNDVAASTRIATAYSQQKNKLLICWTDVAPRRGSCRSGVALLRSGWSRRRARSLFSHRVSPPTRALGRLLSRVMLGDGLPLLMNAPCPHCEQMSTRGSDAAVAPMCPQLGQVIRMSMIVTTAAVGAAARASRARQQLQQLGGVGGDAPPARRGWSRCTPARRPDRVAAAGLGALLRYRANLGRTRPRW